MATVLDVVRRYTSWEGRFGYRQAEGRLDPVRSGFGDCSSTIWRAYKDVLGIDVGTWTGDQVNKGTTVMRGSYLNGWNEAKLQPGDLVLMGGSRGISHVELYVGGGQFSGHGGDVLPGPWRKNARNYIAGWSQWLVKRHVNAPNTNYKPGATVPIAKEVRVKTYTRKDARLPKTVQPDRHFYLHTSKTAKDSNAANVIGGVGPYSLDVMLGLEGQAGEVVGVRAIVQDVRTGKNGHITRWADTTIPPRGYINARHEFKFSVPAGSAVYVQVKASAVAKKPVKVTNLETTAYLFTVA